MSLKYHISTLVVATLLAAHCADAQDRSLVLDTSGHSAFVYQAVFTPDGRHLISASNDDTLRIWEVATGSLVHTIRAEVAPGPRGSIRAVDVAPDGRTLAAAGWFAENGSDEAVRLYDIDPDDPAKSNLKALLTAGTDILLDIAFSPDGRLLAAGSNAGVFIWDMTTHETVHALKHGARDVAFSTSGEYLAAACLDGNLRVWNTTSALPMRTAEENVVSVAYSPDGRLLVTGHQDGRIRLWSAPTHHPYLFIDKRYDYLAQQRGTVNRLVFSPDSLFLLTGGEGISHVFSVPDGFEAGRFNHKTNVTAVAFSPDGMLAATSGELDFAVELWRPEGGQLVRRLVGQGQAIMSVGFARDGSALAYGRSDDVRSGRRQPSLEQTIVLSRNGRYDVSLGEPVLDDNAFVQARFEVDDFRLETDGECHPLLRILRRGVTIHALKSAGGFCSFTFDRDARRFAIGGWSGILGVFERETAELVYDLADHSDVVEAVAISPDGRFLASAADQRVNLWSIETGKLLVSFFVGRPAAGGQLEWAAWTPTGYYTSSPGADRYLHWQLSHGPARLPDVLPGARLRNGYDRPDVIAWTLKLGDPERALQEADRAGALPVAPPIVPEAAPLVAEDAAPYDPAAADPSAAESPLVIDTGGHSSTIRKLLFTPDGRHLISAGDDKDVRIWEVASGRVAHRIVGEAVVGPQGTISTAALSPDGRLLAVAGWMTGSSDKLEAVRLHELDPADASPVAVRPLLRGHTNVVRALAFSPDGRFLASGSADGTIHLWDVAGGRSVHELRGHEGAVEALVFQGGGRMLVSGSRDKTARLWNVASGMFVRKLGAWTSEVRSIDHSPATNALAAGTKDGRVHLWDASKDTFNMLAEQQTSVVSLTFSPDGRFLLTGSGEGTGQRFVEGTLTQSATSGRFAVNSWGLTSAPPISHLFSVEPGGQNKAFPHDGAVTATAFSPDGKLFATSDAKDNGINLWRPAGGKRIKRLVGQGRAVFSVAFAKDGHSVAFGTEVTSPTANRYGPLESTITLARDGRFDVRLGRGVSDEGMFQRAVTLVDGIRLLTPTRTGDPKLSIVRNTTTIYEILRDSTSGSMHLAFSLTSDGRYIVSGAGNGVLTVYDLASGQKVHDLVGHTSDVMAVAVSLDGRFVISGSRDQTVRIWDVSSGRLLVSVFVGYAEGTASEWLAWTPAGYYNASPGGEGFVDWRRDDLPADELRKRFFRPDIVAKTLELRDPLLAPRLADTR